MTPVRLLKADPFFGAAFFIERRRPAGARRGAGGVASGPAGALAQAQGRRWHCKRASRSASAGAGAQAALQAGQQERRGAGSPAALQAALHSELLALQAALQALHVTLQAASAGGVYT